VGKARRSRPATNGTEPTPIQHAIEARELKAQPMRLTLDAAPQPVRLALDGVITIEQGDEANEAQLLVRTRDGLWHGVLFPIGSTFQLKRGGAAAAIWTPPGAKR
jgi:hypothetical protein